MKVNDTMRPKTHALLAALLLLFGMVRGESLSGDPGSRFSTVPHNAALAREVTASGIDRIVVMTDGIMEPLESAARVKLDELTGRQSIHGQDPSYSLLSMVYQPEKWWDARILPVEHPRIAKLLGADDKFVSARFVAENPGRAELQKTASDVFDRKQVLDRLTEKLNAAEQVLRHGNRDLALSNVVSPNVTEGEILELVNDGAKRDAAIRERRELAASHGEDKAFAEATARLIDRANRVGRMHEEFLIIPDVESVRGDWIAPGQRPTAPSRISAAGVELDRVLAGAFSSGSGPVGPAVSEFLSIAAGTRGYPSEFRRDLKNAYVRYSPFRLAAWMYLICAGLYASHFFWGSGWMKHSAWGLMLAGFGFHTAAVGTRLYLAGHMPVSNMYESITFASWAAMMIAVVFEGAGRRGTMGLGACILGFLLLTGSSLMPLHDTRIHPLRAVLNSYWLNIHVTMMLISYAAFGLAAVFAAGCLGKMLLRREAFFGSEPIMTTSQMEEFAYRLVQVGWPILTLGVTLGAVWADTAWGRYWGWDPKETWAFITWIVYTIYLHTRIVMGWRGKMSAACCLLGFTCVIITWLGVSYHPWFAGGLHSYASPT